MKQTFEEWMREVDRELEKSIGLTHDDLADYCYRDAYDDGRRPSSVARAAYRADAGE